jgi:3-oxoacyl-[acyl-carrier protein] reductase
MSAGTRSACSNHAHLHNLSKGVTIDAAIVALAKAFPDRGIADGVQVNSVLPGPVMTGRRRSYLEHWASIHRMTVAGATEKFPKDGALPATGSRKRSLN